MALLTAHSEGVVLDVADTLEHPDCVTASLSIASSQAIQLLSRVPEGSLGAGTSTMRQEGLA